MPFSSRFDELNDRQVIIYLAVLSGAAVTTALVTAPVAFHRILFRRGQRRWLVEAANITARTGLATMAVTIGGVLLLVFDVVVGPAAGAIAIGVALVFFAGVWLVLPWWGHRGQLSETTREQPR